TEKGNAQPRDGMGVGDRASDFGTKLMTDKLHNAMHGGFGLSYCRISDCSQTTEPGIFYAACIRSLGRDWAADFTDRTDQANGGYQNPCHPGLSAARPPRPTSQPGAFTRDQQTKLHGAYGAYAALLFGTPFAPRMITGMRRP